MHYPGYILPYRKTSSADGYLFHEYEVIFGGPQGSHLSPGLFNIFINDIVNNIVSDHLLYADDLKTFRPIACMTDILTLQQDIDWCHVNKLDLNVNKCAAISFTRSQPPIHANYKINDLEIMQVEDVKDTGHHS